MKPRFFFIHAFILLCILNAFAVHAQTSAQQIYYQKLRTDLLSRDYQPVTELNTSLTNGQLYSIPVDLATGVTYKFFLVAPEEVSGSGIELQDGMHFRVKNNLLVRSGNTFLNEFTYYSTHSGPMYAVFACINPSKKASDVHILIYKKSGYYGDDQLLPR